LVGALTFLVISSWLLCRGKSLRFTFFPAVFMLVTTIGALLYQVVNFIKNRDFILGGISIVLIILSLFMVFDVICVIKRRGVKCEII
jgi:carbon starvation protein